VKDFRAGNLFKKSPVPPVTSYRLPGYVSREQNVSVLHVDCIYKMV